MEEQIRIMNQSNKILVTSAELINTFSDIEAKINNLHLRTDTDFLQLNDNLKDYHKKTRTISENAFRVIETIAGKREIDLISELEKIHQRFDDCIEQIENEKVTKVHIIRELIVKSNYLRIALRNYKQDFTSLEYLVTNFRLLSNYADFGISWEETLDKWNIEIESIQSALTSVYCKVNNFKTRISDVSINFESKAEKSLRSLNTLSRAIRDNIISVVQKNIESGTKVPLLKEKTSNSSIGISNIIKHLQYHDIIRQKIEHIQNTHNTIIDSLKNTEESRSIKTGNKLDDYSGIVDITDLQAAQLLLVSKEYQNAIDTILKSFQCISKDISSISQISNEFSYDDSNSEITLLRQIKNQLDEGIILLDLNDFREIILEYYALSKKITEISIQFTQEVHLPVQRLARFDNMRNISEGNIDYKLGVVTQILSLAKDMDTKNKDLCEKLNEIQELSEAFFSSNEMDSLGSQIEVDRINLMVVISRMLFALDKDNDELDTVLNQNCWLNRDITEKIENIINQGDYYDYFENMVGKVIILLNSINLKIKPGYHQETTESKAANLRGVRSTYTMESERIVHDKVISGADDSDYQYSQTSEDEIEFF